MTLSIKIGEFRNHLSAYLRKIRRGAEVTIFDRETPIGRLVPYDRRGDNGDLQMIDPPKGYKGLAPLSFSTCKSAVHAVDELLKERRVR